MSAALPYPPYLSEQEFLAFEAESSSKHEYLHGVVYDMASGSDRHAVISGNIFALLWQQLRGKRCQAYNSDMLARIQHGDDVRMYYPDVSVYCDRAVSNVRVAENPSVIVEVLSPSTERHDATEKRDVYLRIPSLTSLLLVASERRMVSVWTRTDLGWQREDFTDPSATIPLPSIEAELKLSDVYDRSGI